MGANAGDAFLLLSPMQESEISSECTSLMILTKLSTYNNCQKEGEPPKQHEWVLFSLSSLACQGRNGPAEWASQMQPACVST